MDLCPGLHINCLFGIKICISICHKVFPVTCVELAVCFSHVYPTIPCSIPIIELAHLVYLTSTWLPTQHTIFPINITFITKMCNQDGDWLEDKS